MAGSVDLSIPGSASLSRPGAPDVPVMSCLLGIPDRGDVRLEVVSFDEQYLEGYDVAPARPFAQEGKALIEAVPDAAIYGQDAFYPSELASLGEPAVFRDLRVVAVRVNPVRYNPATRTLAVAERVRVRLSYGPGPGINPRSVTRSFRSAAFEPLYASLRGGARAVRRVEAIEGR
jgi:hypothetical protein